MNIEYKNITEITPYSKNAKKHPTDQVKKIAASIQRFGFRQPVVVDKDGVIVIGHGRVEAAKELGMVSVPVTVVDDLTDEEISALRLADNKLNESEWDMELVNMELGEMDNELRELIGFDLLKIDELGTDFTLADGDKPPFQQMTFTLADEQAAKIRDAMTSIRETDHYKFIETFGNENSNGNALYALIMQNYG